MRKTRRGFGGSTSSVTASIKWWIWDTHTHTHSTDKHIYTCVCARTYLHLTQLSVVKSLPANTGEAGLIPGSGRFPGEANGNPLQCSCLGNPMDIEAWQVNSLPLKVVLSVSKCMHICTCIYLFVGGMCVCQIHFILALTELVDLLLPWGVFHTGLQESETWLIDYTTTARP